MFLEIGILTEGVGDLDRLPAVSGVEDVHRSGPAEYVAVVSPHKQFRAVDVPSMNPVERVKIPAGLVWIFRRVGRIIATLTIFHDDLPVGLEIVGAQEQLLTGGKQNVSVLQNASEGDVL